MAEAEHRNGDERHGPETKRRGELINDVSEVVFIQMSSTFPVPSSNPLLLEAQSFDNKEKKFTNMYLT